MRFGLTKDDLYQLATGRPVEFVVPGLETPGHNTTVTIEPADLENIGQYTNTGHLAAGDTDA